MKRKLLLVLLTALMVFLLSLVYASSGDAKEWYQCGNEHLRSGKYDKAVTDYTKAITIKEDYKQAYYNRGNAYVRLGACRRKSL